MTDIDPAEHWVNNAQLSQSERIALLDALVLAAKAEAWTEGEKSGRVNANLYSRFVQWGPALTGGHPEYDVNPYRDEQ